MNRFLSIVLPVLITLVWQSQGLGAPISIKNSKHNLSSISSAGTGSIKAASSGGTTEICVFCHTPHSANTQAPLWNRAASVQSYQTYTSDVLAGLSYYQAEDPSNVGAAGYSVHVKSRVCLSCHDGTIAIGQLANLPFDPSTGKKLTSNVKTINTNADGTMPTAAAGYIGLDLQDDHPTAIPHDNTRDPELQSTILGGAVNLYQWNAGAVQKTNVAGSGNYVECTSCHNAHDNQYGAFLVESNIGSALCTHCHNKRLGAGTSAHDASGVGYNPDGAGTMGTTVGGVKCMNCHYSHKSGVDPLNPTQPSSSFGKYLLSFQEDATCFNNPNRWGRSINVCHAGSSSTKDIQTEQNKLYSHKFASGAGMHKALEANSYGWLGAGNTNWHVQCNDCHNSHSAGATKHTAPGNAIGNASPLYGTGGVNISWTGFWSAPGAGGFTPFEALGLTNSASMPAQYYEYQICLKCHSSFAWGVGTPPASPSFLGLLNMTDQAVEFNPGNVQGNNASMHPVAGVTGNTFGTLLAPWTASLGNQTMYCSDCHNTNGVSAQGPHGSTVPFMLSTSYSDTYSAKGAYQSPGLGNTADLCFQCHSELVYQSGGAGQAGSGFSGSGTNLHTQHRIRSAASVTSTYGYRCVNCHSRVSHGYNRKGMVVRQGEGAPYEAGWTNGGKIVTVNLTGSGAYPVGSANRNSNCTTVNGCHQ